MPGAAPSDAPTCATSASTHCRDSAGPAPSRPTTPPGAAINGNVRNPTTLDYYNRGNLAGVGFTRTFPGAACANFTSHPQGDPGGGCLSDNAQDYGEVQPSQKYTNFFTRGTLNISSALQAYTEINYYKNQAETVVSPASISSNEAFPGGPVSNAAISLGAAHPDNPYFGTAARLRYTAVDVGPRDTDADSDFYRFVLGVKGTAASWDYDSALLRSETRLTQTRRHFLQRDVAYALLNPAGHNLSATLTNAQAAAATSSAYAALPAGSLWRIAENAGLNSPALYAALSPDASADSKSDVTQVDVKATRELMTLPGGPLGVAVGAEVRRESISLTPVAGTERGNIIGLGYSAYAGGRTVAAGYAEFLAPVLKQLELSAAFATTTIPMPAARPRPSSARSTRLSGSWRFEEPTLAVSGRRARPRTASAGSRSSRARAIRHAARSAFPRHAPPPASPASSLRTRH